MKISSLLHTSLACFSDTRKNVRKACNYPGDWFYTGKNNQECMWEQCLTLDNTDFPNYQENCIKEKSLEMYLAGKGNCRFTLWVQDDDCHDPESERFGTLDCENHKEMARFYSTWIKSEKIVFESTKITRFEVEIPKPWECLGEFKDFTANWRECGRDFLAKPASCYDFVNVYEN